MRIHRDRREIQYIVLVSIRTLVHECPSAFSPFLNDFFVKGMDPSFTRMIKLDILVSLCIDPKAIDAVLTELRAYVRHSDKAFVCAAIRAVGKVAELARVVYDRRAHTTEDLDATSARADANVIALNCLSGLVTLSEFSRNAEVVGECAETMQRVLAQLLSDDGMANAVKDPVGIQERALKRLLLIVVGSLNSDDDSVDEEKPPEQTQLQVKTVHVPASAVASTLWVIGEWLTMSKSMLSPWNIDEKSKSKIRLEVLRLLTKSFASLDPQIKLQAVHLSSKVLLMIKADQTSAPDTIEKECSLSELILALARLDVLQDVRDRARYEGNILHMAIGLSVDTSGLQQPPSAASISAASAKSMLLCRKPNASSLPLDNKESGSTQKEAGQLRFGTLSNILCKGPTIPLPTWADEDSSSTLRDPSAARESDLKVNGGDKGMYSSSSEDESSSSSSSSDGSSSSSNEESADESSDSESSDSSDEGSTGVDKNAIVNGEFDIKPAPFQQQPEPIVPSLLNKAGEEASSGSSSDDSSDSDGSSDSDDSSNGGQANAEVDTKPAEGIILDMGAGDDLCRVPLQQHNKQASSSSSVSAGLEGLVMAPFVASKDDFTKPSSIDDDSGAWKDHVRPELSGGLSVKMRFVHGRCRVKEARVLGLDPANPSTVCLQVHVENT